MAKKLKKKIEEMCGLIGIGWEARQERANQILASPEWKQQLCNDLIGLSFRELDHVLTSVANERQKKEDNDEKPARDKQTKSKVGKTASIPRPPPRPLAEILAQVYATRQSPCLPRVREDQDILESYRQAATRGREGLLSYSDNGDDSSEEFPV